VLGETPRPEAGPMRPGALEPLLHKLCVTVDLLPQLSDEQFDEDVDARAPPLAPRSAL
jgi:hypothetical protein